jgi:hypothetical protein
MSKPTDFTPREVELLRDYAREIKGVKRLTDVQLGELMETTQQSVSAFIKDKPTQGIGRIRANSLARSQDFRDAEELLSWLKSREAIAEGGQMGNVWSARDTAKRIAEAMGVAPEAIDAVVAHRKAHADAKRPAKWWVFQFVQQEMQMAADAKEARR